MFIWDLYANCKRVCESLSTVICHTFRNPRSIILTPGTHMTRVKQASKQGSGRVVEQVTSLKLDLHHV